MSKEQNNIIREQVDSSSKGRLEGGTSHQIIKDDEIDLIALIKTIWEGRKTIYYSVGICVFIGLLVAFLSPAKYAASATLLPSAEKKDGNLGNLGALAGMAGINLGSMMGDASGIPAEIYPQIVNSYPFLKEMIYEKYHFEDYEAPMSISEFVLADSVETMRDKILQYSIKLPWTLKNAIFSSEDDSNSGIDYGVLEISVDEMAALEFIRDVIRLDVDDEIGLVTVSAEAKEPVLVAQYVQKAIMLLQKYIVDYKTKQAIENLDFVQERYNEKKQEYESAQKALFNYKDSHRNLVSERISLEYQQLSDSYDIASAVYKGLAQQLEQGRLAVKENTPVYSILEPVRIPKIPSNTKRSVFILLSIISGGFCGVLILFFQKFVKIFKQSINKKI